MSLHVCPGDFFGQFFFFLLLLFGGWGLGARRGGDRGVKKLSFWLSACSVLIVVPLL